MASLEQCQAGGWGRCSPHGPLRQWGESTAPSGGFTHTKCHQVLLVSSIPGFPYLYLLLLFCVYDYWHIVNIVSFRCIAEWFSCTYTLSILFWICVPFRCCRVLSSYLCCTVDPCFIYISVYTSVADFQSITLLTAAPAAQVIISLFFKSVGLFLEISLCHFLRFPHTRDIIWYRTPIVCRLFNYGHSDWCEVTSHCSFDVLFSIN